MEEGSKRVGTPVTQQVVLYDLKNLRFSLNTTALGLFKQTIRIDQDYYPETLAHAFFINVPWCVPQQVSRHSPTCL